MADQPKIRVAVLYGGKSGEHEVSLRSAASILKNLDPALYTMIPIGMDRLGQWRVQSFTPNSVQESAPILQNSPVVVPSTRAGAHGYLIEIEGSNKKIDVDVIFPALHGTFGEDGTVQGLLELANIPYVGSGVLASALGMDKDVAKRLAEAADLPIVPYLVAHKTLWKKNSKAILDRMKSDFELPVFVKPANLGSSVGVHKVKKMGDLANALEDAFQYDQKVLVEKAIAAREIEFSVLENSENPLEPWVSVPGEIVPSHEFYSYEAKYIDEKGADLLIPAKLSKDQIQKFKKIASDAFVVLGCEGMARVDLFLDKEDGKIYFNEVNTIPGFTTISMYPKLWEASGISYKELLTKLIHLALLRHERKNQLKTEK